MRLSTNVFISESLSNTGVRFGSSLDKLSTGIKINKASDDGSGLAIADKLRTQVTSIRSAIDNGNSAVAMLQIADKSMAEQSKILDSIKAKLIQASTDTTSADGRAAIQKDINKLLTQLDNIASQTNYNGRQLISSSNALSAANAHIFQIGEKSSDTITSTSIHANTSGLPQFAGEKSTQSVAINETLNVGDSLSISESDENFDLIFSMGTNAGGFICSGTGGILSTTASDIYFENPTGDLAAYLTAQSTNNGGPNSALQDIGSGSFYLTNGSIDLSGITFSNVLIDFSYDSISWNNTDISSLQLYGAINPINIVGTKDSQVSSSGIKTLADLKDLNTITLDDAKNYQKVVDDSITKLNSYRADMGSTQNQIQSAVRNLMTQATNIETAKSTILDVDYASESANFNKEMIILSAGQFSLTQANTYQSSILSLLK